MPELTPVPGAVPRFDDDGREIVNVVTCGTCGRSWNDAASSSLTPAPSGRCPFEYDHETIIADRLEELRAVLRAERISYGELFELQGLAEHIEPGDVELLEAAGVPEREEDGPAFESFKLELDGGNAAMSSAEDVANALERVASQVRGGAWSARIRDLNGNTVGDFRFTE